MISRNSRRSSLSQSSRHQCQKQNLILSELIYHDKLIRKQQGLNIKRQQSNGKRKPLFQTYMDNLTDISPKFDPYSDSPYQKEKVQIRNTPLPKILPSLARVQSSLSSKRFSMPVNLKTTKSEAAISFNSNSATKSTESWDSNAISSSRPSTSSNPPKIRVPIFQNLKLVQSDIKIKDDYIESTLSTPAQMISPRYPQSKINVNIGKAGKHNDVIVVEKENYQFICVFDNIETSSSNLHQNLSQILVPYAF